MSAPCPAYGRIAALVLAVLVSILSTQATGQDAPLRLSSADKIARLIEAGHDVDAVQLARQAADTAPRSERQAAYRTAMQVCIVVLDVDCARDVVETAAPFLNSLPDAELQPSSLGYVTLLQSFLQVMTGDPQSPAPVLGAGFPNHLVNIARDPVLFADLHLLAAMRARLVLDFEASRDHLDKALAGVLSMERERFDASRLIVRIAGQLAENYDVERALRLTLAAAPLLQTIPAGSFLSYEYLQLRAALLGYRKDLDGASRDRRLALSKLEQLQLTPVLKSHLESTAYTDLLGVEALRGDQEATRRLLASHPLMAAKPAILKRGYLASAGEFNLALAEEFARLALNDPTEAGWGDLLTMPPRWTHDPERRQEVEAFGQAAVGLRLLRSGRKDEARREFIEAGKKRLSTLQDRYRRSVYASPLPYWTDQVLLQFALAATLSETTPDYDLVLQAHVVLNRSMATNADDALTIQAVQTSDERKRIAQSLRTIQYQQQDWEKARLEDLARRLLSGEKRDADAVDRSRRQIFYGANNFLQQQQRLRAALDDGSTGKGVDLVARVGTLKGVLLADEALVFHVPMAGQVGKVCIRTDQTLSSTQEFDAATTSADARLLRAALTAAHPPSPEADSQFPASQAVRLGKLMFGGLEECLRPSRRVYLVATGDIVGQVPPSALLAEIPPSLGAGFDLRSAHWLVRDHSFVRTTSIDAFVATKTLSKTRRATLDYLGVGDPALAPRNAASPSGGQIAARDSVPVQSGALNALPELPETSEELERVAQLFAPSKVRLVRRDGASEEEFRLQPLSEFDVVHFATHGLIREEQPGLREPALVLTPHPGGDSLNDGLLTSSQIAGLPFKARLVVLSACNSARYEPSIIDSGIQGLSTSFAIAGVPSTIASLWPIESSLTRDLIIATFQAARGGKAAIADALTVAVRKHLDGPTPRPLLHPRFWAALVVLGDGSMMLDAPTPGARDLGPFAPAHSSNGDEILSSAALGDDFVTATIGGWNGAKSPSLLRRQAIDGTTKWEVEDGEIGAGPAAVAGDMIYAGGYRSIPDGALVRSVPVLRGLSADGRVLWSRQLPGGPQSTFVMGLATGPDKAAFALLGPSRGEESGAAFSLIRFNDAGADVAHMSIAVSGDARWGQSGHFAAGKDAGLVAINHNARPQQPPQGYDELGLARFCFEGDAAEIVLVDLPRLEEKRRVRIDRFRAHSALAVSDGWILVGADRDECSQETRAAAYTLKADGSLARLWRDASPFRTSARGVRKVGGITEIVGYAERSVAVRQEVPVFTMPDFASRRWGNEAHVSGEVFSVRLSGQGVEQQRDFVGAGFPVVPLGMASTGEHSAIFGTIASRALWMAR